jgi:hypothetical protein
MVKPFLAVAEAVPSPPFPSFTHHALTTFSTECCLSRKQTYDVSFPVDDLMDVVQESAELQAQKGSTTAGRTSRPMRLNISDRRATAARA